MKATAQESYCLYISDASKPDLQDLFETRSIQATRNTFLSVYIAELHVEL